MENKSFNIVVLHKQSGWSKFKRRLSSWFSSDQTGEPRVVPEIIVTSHEDVPDELVPAKPPETPGARPEETSEDLKFRKAGQDELAQAHQNVIQQMRNSLAEARGARGTPGDHGPTVSGTSERDRNVKPPIPPTKAAAVAKIRETIAQAKRASSSDLAGTENSPGNNDLVKENKQMPGPERSLETRRGEKLENNYQAAAPPLEGKASPADSGAKQTHNSSEEQQNPTEEDKEARRAAIRAKLRNAILGAAAGGVLTDSSRDKTEPRIANTRQAPPPPPPPPAAPTGRKEPAKRPVRRANSSSGSQQEKQKETIWQFFQEGNKKGTCRTCGYVVGIKNNKGGLTRHLSLVHQREYKLYTAKMEQNWTNGMLEKNLNMRVPANL